MKNLVTTTCLAAIALGALGAVPVSAGTCWSWQPSSSHRAQGKYCRVSQRVNANGHKVIDVDEATVVIWDDNTAEVLHRNIPYQKRWFSWNIDRQGDYQFHGAPGYSFSFRF